MPRAVILLGSLAACAVAGCGGSGHSAQPPTTSRPGILVASDVDDLSTATPGSCRTYIREIEVALRSGVASSERFALRATLAHYRAAFAKDPDAGCVDPMPAKQPDAGTVYYEGHFSSADAQTNPVSPVTP